MSDRATQKTETEIKKEISDQLKAHGFIVNRLQSGKVKVRGGWMELCESGTPDYHVLGFHGNHFFWEAKKPDGKASEIQLEKKAEYERRGFTVYIADSILDLFGQMGMKL